MGLMLLRNVRPTTLAILLLTMGLAGCAGGDGDTQSATLSTPTGPDHETGAVQGVVVGDEGLPVPNVTVVIQLSDGSSEPSDRTDENGAFEIAGLPAGSHKIFLERLGYESVARPVTVVAGETTELEFTIMPIEVTEVFHTTEILAGFIGCSITVIYPAGSPGYTAWQCGDVAGNEPWYPNHEPYLNWTVPEDVVTHLLELTWEPASSSADQLRWQIATNLDCYLNLCFVGGEYQTQGGPAPLEYRLEDGEGLPDDLPSPFMSRVSSGPATTTSPVRVVIEQPFEQYTSSWFGEPAPETWTALPPGP